MTEIKIERKRSHQKTYAAIWFIGAAILTVMMFYYIIFKPTDAVFVISLVCLAVITLFVILGLEILKHTTLVIINENGVATNVESRKAKLIHWPQITRISGARSKYDWHLYVQYYDENNKECTERICLAATGLNQASLDNMFYTLRTEYNAPAEKIQRGCFRI